MAKKNLFSFPNSESIKVRVGKSHVGSNSDFGDYVAEQFKNREVKPREFVTEFEEIFSIFNIDIGDIFNKLFSNNVDFLDRVKTLWDKNQKKTIKSIKEDAVSRDTEDATPDNELTFTEKAFVDSQVLLDDISVETETTEEENEQVGVVETAEVVDTTDTTEETQSTSDSEETADIVMEDLSVTLKNFKVADLRLIAQLNGVDVSKLSIKQDIVNRLLEVDNLVLLNK